MLHSSLCLLAMAGTIIPLCTAFLATPTLFTPRSRVLALHRGASVSFRPVLDTRKPGLTCAAAADAGYTPTPPPVSPASALPNNIYTWRDQQIRYQVAGPVDAKQTAVLVHGLFVNADQWRFTLKVFLRTTICLCVCGHR